MARSAKPNFMFKIGIFQLQTRSLRPDRYEEKVERNEYRLDRSHSILEETEVKEILNFEYVTVTRW